MGLNLFLSGFYYKFFMSNCRKFGKVPLNLNKLLLIPLIRFYFLVFEFFSIPVFFDPGHKFTDCPDNDMMLPHAQHESRMIICKSVLNCDWLVLFSSVVASCSISHLVRLSWATRNSW